MRERTGAIGADLDLSHRTRASTTLALARASRAPAEDEMGRWRDSSSAPGVERDGRAVIVRVRTPEDMLVRSLRLATAQIGLRDLEQTVADAGEGGRGGREHGLHEGDDLHEMWDVPHVVGVERR